MIADRLLPEPRDSFGSPRPCPVCGKTWRPWKGSRLQCHARCFWSDDEAVALVETLEPIRELAARMGLTIALVRAGIQKGGQVLRGETP